MKPLQQAKVIAERICEQIHDTREGEVRIIQRDPIESDECIQISIVETVRRFICFLFPVKVDYLLFIVTVRPKHGSEALQVHVFDPTLRKIEQHARDASFTSEGHLVATG